MLEVLIATFVLLFLAVAGLAVRLLFNKNAEFRGGSCQSSYNSDEFTEKGIQCGCGGACESTNQ